jgi:nucleotide-binding universal stress UspA family protein
MTAGSEGLMNLSVTRAAYSRTEHERDTRSLTLVRPEILLATDGTPAALAATRFTGALAERWGLRPHVFTVLPPPVPIDPLLTSLPSRLDPELCAEQEIARQLATCSPNADNWTRETVIGAPADEIAHVARARSSDLIIMGLRPHALLDRVFRDETALTVMRRASVPVLAVTPLLRRLPRRIAVATDFSRASIAAARAAMGLLEEGGELLLVYVEPPSESEAEQSAPYRAIYTEGLSGAFARLRQELVSRSDVTTDTVVLRGAVPGELLSLAARADVDLIAVGSQRHSIARRAFVGGVTTALARAASRSLLVIPPDGHA